MLPFLLPQTTNLRFDGLFVHGDADASATELDLRLQQHPAVTRLMASLQAHLAGKGLGERKLRSQFPYCTILRGLQARARHSHAATPAKARTPHRPFPAPPLSPSPPLPTGARGTPRPSLPLPPQGSKRRSWWSSANRSRDKSFGDADHRDAPDMPRGDAVPPRWLHRQLHAGARSPRPPARPHCRRTPWVARIGQVRGRANGGCGGQGEAVRRRGADFYFTTPSGEYNFARRSHRKRTPSRFSSSSPHCRCTIAFSLNCALPAFDVPRRHARADAAAREGLVIVDNVHSQLWEYEPYVSLAERFAYAVEVKEIVCAA